MSFYILEGFYQTTIFPQTKFETSVNVTVDTFY
jgi:hypothetical protein